MIALVKGPGPHVTFNYIHHSIYCEHVHTVQERNTCTTMFIFLYIRCCSYTLYIHTTFTYICSVSMLSSVCEGGGGTMPIA